MYTDGWEFKSDIAFLTSCGRLDVALDYVLAVGGEDGYATSGADIVNKDVVEVLDVEQYLTARGEGDVDGSSRI